MSEWANFSDEELNCHCCGEANPNMEFVELMDLVQEMREELGFAFTITSAYRCPVHPIEKDKATPGQHAVAAIDIAVSGGEAVKLVELALSKGFTGIGVNQKGLHKQRFIHLDMRDIPYIWSY